ncbi:YceI family protein [Saccharopolyspora sp. MS10]|uniref:YceI family protein n=1 Tax=Saccharopolyspora sp. MS10 TaxID=3385973 RepID=UPI00399FF47B
MTAVENSRSDVDGAGGVTATVRTGDGWPVPEAALTLIDAGGGQAARVRSDEEGAAVVTGLRPGTYTAIVTTPGYEPLARTTLVRAGQDARLGVLELRRAGGAELPAPGTWVIDPAHSSVRVSARHLGITSIHGRFTEFSGEIEVGDPVESTEVRVRIDAASVDTANQQRDAHLRTADFLDVERHPEITFTATGLRPAGGERWELAGDLTLCGVTRPVVLDTHYAGVGPDPWGGSRASASATAELRREDFAITFNQALRTGIAAIGTTLRVDIDVQAVQQG